MLYNYVALAVFTVLAFMMPVGLLVVSKLIARRYPGNRVKNSPWESGEVSVGRARDIENEYLPFFSLFLPFEVVAGILLVWASSAFALGFTTDMSIIALAVAASGAAFLGYKTIVSG